MNYKKYKIAGTDSFKPLDFPKVIDELEILNGVLAELPPAYKKEIVVSFLKRQSLQDDWIIANPELTSLITSGVFKTDNLESLFDSCGQNKEFCRQYEEYISETIS